MINDPTSCVNMIAAQGIQTRTKEVRNLWDDLMELTFARHEALIGARKIHSFDRKIDEILDRMLKTETPFSIKRQSIYVSTTISLVTHYHNISGKAFIQTECYKRFSSNALPEFLL